MSLWHIITFTQMSLRLVPKILDAIDMIFSIRKGLGMVDPVVLEITDIQNIVTTPTVRIDNAIRDNFAGHDGHQRLARRIRSDFFYKPSHRA